MNEFFLGTGCGAVVGMLYGMWIHLHHVRELERIAKSWCARWRESEAERIRLVHRLVQIKVDEAESNLAPGDDIYRC